MAQIDLTRGAILLREQFLELLVEAGFVERVHRPTLGDRPPADDIDSVLTIAQFGPVLRSTELLDQTIEDRLILIDGKEDFVTLARAVNLRDDLHNPEGSGCSGHASLINVLCPPYIIFVFISALIMEINTHHSTDLPMPFTLR